MLPFYSEVHRDNLISLAVKDSGAPEQEKYLEAAEHRIGRAYDRLAELIAQLNERADAVFGAMPPSELTPSELKGQSQEVVTSGSLGRLFREIFALEGTLPSLTQAIERFERLA